MNECEKEREYRVVCLNGLMYFMNRERERQRGREREVSCFLYLLRVSRRCSNNHNSIWFILSWHVWHLSHSHEQSSQWSINQSFSQMNIEINI